MVRVTASQPSRGGNTPVEKIRYRGKTYYLSDGKIYDNSRNVILENVENGFLDLYEYFEYFEPNEPGRAV